MKILETLFIILMITLQVDLYGQVSQGFQVFVISVNKDTSVFGREGTEIIIPKFAFKKENEEIIRDTFVHLLLKEIYDKGSMVTEGISTTSGEDLLISNGMIHIKAVFGGEEIGVIENVITIRMPSFTFDT